MRLHLILLLVAALAWPTHVHADAKSEAKKHLTAATAAHKDGRLDDALTELNIAYTLEPQPALLYAIGQVYVMQGKCSQAITFYQRFLDARPEPAQAAKATEAIETCKKLQPQVTPVEPTPTPTPTPTPAPTPVAPPPVATSTRSPWYTDVLGGVLTGTGAASAIVGVVMWSSSRSDRDAAEAEPDYQGYNDRVESARSKRTYAVVFAAGGTALITAGVIRYLTRRDGREQRSVAVVPMTGGGLVTWGARF